tara:strand:- start:1228 stop:1728 length:501 start_codon:yes stop_codon:yes gene_type:complete
MYLNYFFDRDNTLIIDKGYTHNLKDLKWIPGALDVLKTLSSKNKRIFIVTNQAGIAKGKFTLKQYKIFNNFMLSELLKHSVKVEQVIFCPFHKNSVIKRFRADSYFRKPNPGMILKIVNKKHLSKSECIMIGDKMTDLKAGHAAGIDSYLFNQVNLFEFMENKKLI